MNYPIRTYAYTFILMLVFLLSTATYAQVKRPLSDADKAALEGIIVEKYYTYDGSEKTDTTGGALPKGAVTYRIFVDLKPGYSLQAVYGVMAHPLFIKTTTQFFNNTNGQGTADYVDTKKMTNNTLFFDSWLTMGAAGENYMAIPKADDTDGSVIRLKSFEKADGLVAAKIKPITYFGIIPHFFNTVNAANTFSTDNGSWAIFGGMKGVTEDNKILIAQLTTNGELSYELNLQIGTPAGVSVNYVAKNPENMELPFAGLTK